MTHPVKPVLAAVAFVLLAFLASLWWGSAGAGVTQTVTEQRYQLHDGQGTPVRELVDNKLVPVMRTTLKDCQTAGEIEFRNKLSVDEANFRCVQVTVTTYKGNCDDEPQPGPDDAIEGTIDGEGFTIIAKLETAACLADDTKFDIREVKWLKKSWREKCWQKVETPLATCDGKLPVADIDVPDLPWSTTIPADRPAVGSDPAPTCATATCDEPGDVKL